MSEGPAEPGPAASLPQPQASRPSRVGVWREVVVVLVALAAVVVAAAPVRRALTAWPTSLAVSWLAYAVMAGVVVLAVRRAGRSSGPAFGLERARPGRQAAVGVAVAAGLLAVVLGVPVALGAPVSDLAGTWQGSGAKLAAQLVTAVLVVGPVEELVFRGYLLGRLRGVMRPGSAVVVQAVLFGLWHFPRNQDVLQVAITTGIGLVLGVIRLRVRGGTVAALGLGHGLYDAALTVASWLAT